MNVAPSCGGPPGEAICCQRQVLSLFLSTKTPGLLIRCYSTWSGRLVGTVERSGRPEGESNGLRAKLIALSICLAI